MKKHSFILLSILLINHFNTNAQCAYTFSLSTAPYQALVSPTSINTGQVWIHSSSYTLPLGFTFPLTAGRTANSVNVLAGSIEFLTSTTPYMLLVYHWPFGGNMLTDKGYGSSSSLSPISYEVTGNLGNKIAKIQYANAGLDYDYESFCTTPTGLDYVNFQFWLYEATGTVEVHFGPNSVNNPHSYNCTSTSGGGPFEKFLVDNYFLNPWNNASNPVTQCLNNTGIVYGNSMNATTANDSTVYIFNPVQNYVTNLKSTALKKGVKIYPNPVIDILNIDKDDSFSENEFEIIDYTGRTVMTGKTAKNIDVSNLNSGIYFLKISNEAPIKIIKE